MKLGRALMLVGLAASIQPDDRHTHRQRGVVHQFPGKRDRCHQGQPIAAFQPGLCHAAAQRANLVHEPGPVQRLPATCRAPVLKGNGVGRAFGPSHQPGMHGV